MRDLGKLIVAKGIKRLPKVQKIAKSGHTAYEFVLFAITNMYYFGHKFLSLYVTTLVDMVLDIWNSHSTQTMHFPRMGVAVEKNSLPDDCGGDDTVDEIFRCRRDSQSVIEWRRVKPTFNDCRVDVNLAKSRATEMQKTHE